MDPVGALLFSHHCCFNFFRDFILDGLSSYVRIISGRFFVVIFCDSYSFEVCSSLLYNSYPSVCYTVFIKPYLPGFVYDVLQFKGKLFCKLDDNFLFNSFYAPDVKGYCTV